MFEIILEYLARLSRHFGAFEADHQLVIDVQAALIEVGRANVHDIVNNDQLGMENLRLIFANLNSAFEQPAIKALRGELR